MAVKTTYTCDLCGHTQDDSNQMWWVGVSIDQNRHTSQRYAKMDQLWCRACALKRHLLPFSDEKQKAKAPPPPTLEDLVREIVREEVADA